MGLLTTLRDAVTMTSAASRAVPYESPWASPNHLEHFDLPPGAPAKLTRSAALRVPAVVRARRLIVTNLPRCPLVPYAGTAELVGANRPPWIDSTDGPWSPYHRMLWTVDDLFFYGLSAWAVARAGGNGPVIAADRIPFEQWTIDPDTGHVLWNNREVAATDVIVIPGVDEGILAYGADPVGHAADLADGARKAARSPVLNTIIKQLSGEPLPPDKRKAVGDDFVAARRKTDHGVSFASANVDVVEAGKRDPALLVEGRNAAAIDIARLTGIPAALLDADTGSGMTYQNTNARMAELVDFGLAPYMSAIAGRLGMDDMMPAGQSLAFNTTVLTGVADGDVAPPDDGNQSRPVTPLASVRPA